jgi:alpha-mannosidase
MLLDGPQGVGGAVDRLGVSLLRSPTWPDPQADNGWQRMRVALMPCRSGWRQDGVSAAAQAFREPLWCRPLAPDQADRLTWPAGSSGAGWVGLEALPVGVQLLRLVQDPDQPGVVRIALPNLTPIRQSVCFGGGWQQPEQLDGLDQIIEPVAGGSGGRRNAMKTNAIETLPRANLAPWALGFWRLRRQSS